MVFLESNYRKSGSAIGSFHFPVENVEFHLKDSMCRFCEGKKGVGNATRYYIVYTTAYTFPCFKLFMYIVIKWRYETCKVSVKFCTRPVSHYIFPLPCNINYYLTPVYSYILYMYAPKFNVNWPNLSTPVYILLRCNVPTQKQSKFTTCWPLTFV